MRYSHIAEHFPFPSFNRRIFPSIRLPLDNFTKKPSEIVKHIRPSVDNYVIKNFTGVYIASSYF